MEKKILRFAIISILFIFMSVPTFAQTEINDIANGVGIKYGWVYENSSWYYINETGNKTIGKLELPDGLYFFNENGQMQTGWKKIEDSWYYFDTEGRVKTGWFTQGGGTYYAEKSGTNKGKCCEGLTEIDGKKYYFRPNGSCNQASGWIKIENRWHYFAKEGIYTDKYEKELEYVDETKGYGMFTMEDGRRGYVGADGKVEAGWKNINGKWYYFDKEGIGKTGWLQDGKKWYYLNKDGTMAQGKLDLGDEMYYLNPSGERVTGWKKIENNWYYFDTEGRVKTGWFTQGGGTYYAEKSGTNKGKCCEGLTEIDGKKYYFRPNGSCNQASGWIKIENRWRYFAKEGIYTDKYEKELKYIDETKGYGMFTMEDGRRGYISADGKVEAGWKNINGKWYYFDKEGIGKTGWLQDGKKWYYLNEDGTMAQGKLDLGNEMYYLDLSGERVTGWKKIENNWYYFDTEGRVKTGWFTQGGGTYYAEKSGTNKGKCCEGLTEIEGKKYYFRPNGSCNQASGWIKIENRWRYFAKEGIYTDKYEKELKYIDETKGYGMFTMEDGRRGYISADGKVEAGWKSINGKWYYFDKEGIGKTGWLQDGKKWYYLNEDGTMAQGKLDLGNEMYYLNLSGELVTGWKKIEDSWYYFDTEGRVKTGWFTQGGGTYYAEKSGANKGKCCEGLTEIDGKKYYFEPNGSCNMRKGWITTKQGWYYADTSSGILYTGRRMVSGISYLFNPDGILIDESLLVISSIRNANNTITLEWNEIKGAEKYIVEYSRTGDFSEKDIEVFTVMTNKHQLKNTGNNIYYVRIKAVFVMGNEGTEVYESQYSPVECTIEEKKLSGDDVKEISWRILRKEESAIVIGLDAELKYRVKSADGFYYLVAIESYGNEIADMSPLIRVDKNTKISEEIVVTYEDIKGYLMDKVAIAVKMKDGEYSLISSPTAIENPEMLARNTLTKFRASSKKGLQGIVYSSYDGGTDIVDARNANTKQTLLNLDISSIVSPISKEGYEAYTYKGNIYYFSELIDLQKEIESLNSGYKQYLYGHDGTTKVAVSLCLLLGYNSENSYLIDPSARVQGHKYYMLNVREEKARETLEALFFYLGEIFGQKNCYVTNWILGNEINSSRAWNYSGNLDFATYMECYTTAFRLLYNGVKYTKTGNTVSLSLDNGWAVAPDTYAGKITLDTFAKEIHEQNPNVEWSVAYHPYSYPLTKVDFWNDYSNTTESLSTKYISMKNIGILTDYVSTLEKRYGISPGTIRVLLTEQGYSYSGGAENQAFAIARGYYIAEFSDRIDAFIIRAVIDDPDETQGQLYFGLLNRLHEKRTSFYVYEYMDSDVDQFKNIPLSNVSQKNQVKFAKAKEILCDTNWSSLITGYNKEKLSNIH